jgi:hypothetical protein
MSSVYARRIGEDEVRTAKAVLDAELPTIDYAGLDYGAAYKP